MSICSIKYGRYILCLSTMLSAVAIFSIALIVDEVLAACVKCDCVNLLNVCGDTTEEADCLNWYHVQGLQLIYASSCDSLPLDLLLENGNKFREALGQGNCPPYDGFWMDGLSTHNFGSTWYIRDWEKCQSPPGS